MSTRFFHLAGIKLIPTAAGCLVEFQMPAAFFGSAWSRAVQSCMSLWCSLFISHAATQRGSPSLRLMYQRPEDDINCAELEDLEQFVEERAHPEAPWPAQLRLLLNNNKPMPPLPLPRTNGTATSLPHPCVIFQSLRCSCRHC
jgi:hypothetical protein